MKTYKLPVRWGIIGCGDVTEKKSGPAYQKVEGFVLKAVMRRNDEMAKDYARRHHVEIFTSDADEVISHPEIDAVYIATPPDTHKFYALKVAEAGKPCCVEKPMAPTYADGLEMHKAFAEKNIPLFVAYYRRSLPRFIKIKGLLESGSIGDIRHITWQLNKPAGLDELAGKYNWRTDKEIALGGHFDDLASHGLDLFAWLCGEFEDAKGIGLNRQRLYTSLDTVAACWQHRSGVTGSGGWNFGCHEVVDEVVIYGSLGKITFAVFDDQPITLKRTGTSEIFMIEHPENIQFFHVQNMRDHLIGKTVHPSTGDTGLHTAWVMDKILGRIQ
ncbi:MAG: Gfo/Idh/MocA family oxidoreductase [Candidatus Marinimicrobia bacterium]|nr:Gfo/Idh/MocA family oxidoreductase [Candidatus Neomarinimicrobiota bacterium]